MRFTTLELLAPQNFRRFKGTPLAIMTVADLEAAIALLSSQLPSKLREEDDD